MEKNNKRNLGPAKLRKHLVQKQRSIHFKGHASECLCCYKCLPLLILDNSLEFLFRASSPITLNRNFQTMDFCDDFSLRRRKLIGPCEQITKLVSRICKEDISCLSILWSSSCAPFIILLWNNAMIGSAWRFRSPPHPNDFISWKDTSNLFKFSPVHLS